MSIASQYNYIIIGAGIAGLTAIKAIREHDSSPILLISNEDRLPYKRTQINKLLSKGFSKNELAIEDESYFSRNSIDLLLDEVLAIDTTKKTISTINHSTTYKKLLLATGKLPKTSDFQNIPTNRRFTVYKAEDSERLIQFATNHRRFLILGGGVEGVEMAYQLHLMQKNVSLIHNSNHLINKQFSPPISDMIEAKLHDNHIDIIKTNDFTIEFNQVQITLTESGRQIIFDAIIECIGAIPNIKLAQKAGLKTHQGICVDSYLQTSAKDVFAAGDVAQLEGGIVSGLWHFAEHQGETAGANMCGQTTLYTPKPFRLKTEIFNNFFFSMTYSAITSSDSKLCETSKEKYRELYLRDNQLIAVLMVNDKENAKMYEKAVRENWSLDYFKEQLPF